ncbi:UDP-N-acetylglucosamine transferase subunit ALG14-like [Antedon mediterranea]|uniref:UDP-N-acetylglucosamine transferase subunit ALG14-like n=1 Tax=Antedon mediterranea TaxID=105859 RepID=UPI003AF5AA78
MAAPYLLYIFVTLFAIILVLFTRLLVVLLSLGKQSKCTNHNGKIKVLVIAGSGGHTSEVIRLLSGLSDSYAPRIYVVADTDTMSHEKIKKFEDSKKNIESCSKSVSESYIIHNIPRSREVRQSYITSVFSTLYSTLYAFPLVFKVAPDLILCNGPGTCIPLCFAGFIMRILGLKKVIQVYVESICRVQHLSLSGKIMYHFADHIIVQWESLQKIYPKSKYLGKIC